MSDDANKPAPAADPAPADKPLPYPAGLPVVAPVVAPWHLDHWINRYQAPKP